MTVAVDHQQLGIEVVRIELVGLAQRTERGRRIAELQLRYNEASEMLRVKASMDSLTGLHNRAEILRVLDEFTKSAPEDAARALELGAHAVVVGSAITRPQLITKRFAEAVAPEPPQA